MTPAEFCHAIAMIESDDKPEAWGDGGQAMGRYQYHPAALLETAAFYRVVPRVNSTWDDFAMSTLTMLFLHHYPQHPPVAIAMRHHRGHWTFPGDAAWDEKYAAKFEELTNAATR